MVDLQTAHTADLPPESLAAVRVLLYAVFDDMTDEDFEHGLGGLHVLVWDGAELIGHGSLIMRRLMHAGRALRAGYVEAVAVRADQQRRGHGAAIMTELERVIARAYEIGALGSTDEGAAFYAARGWLPWRGSLSALTPTGTVRTPDEEGCVYVLAGAVALDLDGDLCCDWRSGDVW